MFSLRPVLTRFELEAHADLESCWAVLSDTDRFNRAAGMDMRFEEQADAEGNYAPTGRMKRLGMTQRWEELPWQWQAPRCFRAERRFLGGPVDRVVAELRLESSGAGTRIHYQIAAYPRIAAARPLLLADSATSTRPQLDRALRAAVAAIEAQAGGAPVTGFDPEPPPLDPAARQCLAQGLAAVQDSDLAQHLAQLVAVAPLAEQSRIHASVLAERLRRPPAQVLRGLLQATRGGALALRWELRCPSCRAPKATVSVLGVEPTSVHCVSCQLRYDGTFPDAVLVSFRPAPTVRDFELPAECLYSPQRTPHLRLRERLPAGDLADLDVELEAGAWILELGEDRVSIEVSEEAFAEVATVQLGPQGAVPKLLRLRPGPLRLVLRSRLEQEVAVLLRQRAEQHKPTTLGQLFSLPDVLELLPEGALAPGLDARAGTGTVLVVDELLSRGEQLVELAAWLRDLGPQTLRETEGALLATWASPDGALAAGRRLVGHLGLAVALDHGPMLTLQQGGQALPCGQAVDRTLDLARSLGAGRVALGRQLAARPEVALQLADVERVPSGAVTLLRDRGARDRYVRALQAAAPAEPPQLLGGRYRLGAILGSGGQGAVYQVVDEQTGDELVAKLLRPEVMARPRQVQFFVDEARIAATLDHPSIPAVLDVGMARGEQLWMVMEQVQGETLAARLDGSGPLTEVQAAAVARQLLSALAVVHAAGLVHRDVKPDNVMIDTRGGVHLLDLGIARLAHDEDDPTAEGTVVGTPLYLAPEQLQPPYLAGPRTDLYALGLLLHTMLTARPPFTGSSPVQVAMARLHRDPPPLDSVSAGLRAVVERATARDPQARYSSAQDMAAAL